MAKRRDRYFRTNRKQVWVARCTLHILVEFEPKYRTSSDLVAWAVSKVQASRLVILYPKSRACAISAKIV